MSKTDNCFVISLDFGYVPLRERYANTEFFPVRIFLYSVQMQENTEQK